VLSAISSFLSQPVAVLPNEDASTIASQAGFRCFTDGNMFRRHVEAEVLGEISG
jgi:hypothetical protein